MSTSTSRYAFEDAIAVWARDFSIQMTGRVCSFFVGFRPDGTLRRVYFGLPEADLLGERKAALADMYTHWFLFAVDGGERAIGYVEWLDLPQGTVERWIGRSLADEDFTESGRRLDGWPTHWRVIVG